MKNSIVHVRVSEELKTNVEKILREIGLSLSYPINVYLKKLKRNAAFLFLLY